MKKLILLFISLLTAGIATSQIVITSAEVVGQGDVVVQAYDDDPDPSIQPGDAGANISWDFSALVEGEVDTLHFINPDDTPYGGEYPSANLAMTISDSGYFYMEKNSDKMAWIGMVTDFDTLGMMNVPVVPEDIVADFDMEYGNTLDESFYLLLQFEGTVPQVDSIRMKMTTESSSEIDAWGEVTLPMGTYNALRVHETATSTDSIWIKTALGWTFTSATESSSESYSWWSDDPGTGFVLATLSMDEEDRQATNVTYMKTEVIQDVEEVAFNAEDVNVFPNPVSDVLNISFTQEMNGAIQIIDLTGRTVESRNINSTFMSVDLANEPEGIYFYRILNEADMPLHTGKVVKK